MYCSTVLVDKEFENLKIVIIPRYTKVKIMLSILSKVFLIVIMTVSTSVDQEMVTIFGMNIYQFTTQLTHANDSEKVIFSYGIERQNEMRS